MRGGTPDQAARPAEPSPEGRNGHAVGRAGEDSPLCAGPLAITRPSTAQAAGPSLWTAALCSLSQVLNELPCGNGSAGLSADMGSDYGNHRDTWPCINYSAPHELSSEGICSAGTWEQPLCDGGAASKDLYKEPGVPHLLLTFTPSGQLPAPKTSFSRLSRQPLEPAALG